MSLPIGEKLRQERLARKLSLEQVAQQTRIRLRYLEALEKGELDSLPSLTQARGFIRTGSGNSRRHVRSRGAVFSTGHAQGTAVKLFFHLFRLSKRAGKMFADENNFTPRDG